MRESHIILFVLESRYTPETPAQSGKRLKTVGGYPYKELVEGIVNLAAGSPHGTAFHYFCPELIRCQSAFLKQFERTFLAIVAQEFPISDIPNPGKPSHNSPGGYPLSRRQDQTAGSLSSYFQHFIKQSYISPRDGLRREARRHMAMQLLRRHRCRTQRPPQALGYIPGTAGLRKVARRQMVYYVPCPPRFVATGTHPAAIPSITVPGRVSYRDVDSTTSAPAYALASSSRPLSPPRACGKRSPEKPLDRVLRRKTRPPPFQPDQDNCPPICSGLHGKRKPLYRVVKPCRPHYDTAASALRSPCRRRKNPPQERR